MVPGALQGKPSKRSCFKDKEKKWKAPVEWCLRFSLTSIHTFIHIWTKLFLQCYGLNSSVLDKHSNTSLAPYFIYYTGSCSVAQTGLNFLGSSNSVSSASEYLGLQVCSTEPTSFLKTRKLKYDEAYKSDQGHHGKNCKVGQSKFLNKVTLLSEVYTFKHQQPWNLEDPSQVRYLRHICVVFNLPSSL